MSLDRALALVTTLLAAGGCAPPASEGGFDSPNPASRLYAIEGAARRHDDSPATLRRLVEQLDADDPAVRFLAIGALERLTGETHGYHYDDPPAARRLAIARWTEALGSDSLRGPEAGVMGSLPHE